MAATTAAPTAERGLRRELGLASTIAVIVGQTIAVGIFLTPAGMAKALGSPAWLLVVWVLMGGMTLCGAFSFGALASAFPRTGGIYAFLRAAYGRRVAFLYGWMCLLVMDPGLAAALVIGLTKYIAYLYPAADVTLFGVGTILALAGLNLAGTRASAGFLRWITWLKIALLVLLPAWAVAMSAGDWSNLSPFVQRRAGSPVLAEAIPVAVIAAFFSFGGWWEVSRVAGEVRDPARTLPRALMAGILLVTAIYIVISATFLYAVPLEQVTSDEAFVAAMGEALFGTAGGMVLAAIVAISIASSLAAFMFAAPRVYFAMAEDGVFLPQIARLHQRLGTPVYAIVLQAGLASLLSVFGTFTEVIAYFIFATIGFIGMAAAAVFLPRWRKRQLALPWGYPVTPAVFLLLVGAMLALLLVGRPYQSLLGVAMVALGLPVYEWFARTYPKRHQRETPRPS